MFRAAERGELPELPPATPAALMALITACAARRPAARTTALRCLDALAPILVGALPKSIHWLHVSIITVCRIYPRYDSCLTLLCEPQAQHLDAGGSRLETRVARAVRAEKAARAERASTAAFEAEATAAKAEAAAAKAALMVLQAEFGALQQRTVTRTSK